MEHRGGPGLQGDIWVGRQRGLVLEAGREAVGQPDLPGQAAKGIIRSHHGNYWNRHAQVPPCN